MLRQKITLLILSLLFIFSSLDAFSKQASSKPILTQVGKHKHWCPVCGMDIKMFYKTSHTSKLDNSKNRQYCSLRCLAVDMQEYKIDIKNIKVVDALNEKYIDAKTSFYVVGSDVKGTMSKISKLAFENAEQADDFSMENGGEIVDFATALKMAQESLKLDIAMVSKKKNKKIYPMGKKIFEKACSKNIDPKNYLEINELKADIKNSKLCKPLKENQLQALSLYLFELKRFEDLKKIDGTIKVTKDEKCPVCGMFVYKYPKWVAQIYYGDKHLSFDGVKDMMKYYFEHKDGISKILVSDYYSQKTIDAQKSYFVIGSDVYGPMGNELIPFKNKDEAKTFSLDHKAKRIIKFSEITKEEVNSLDE